MKATAAIQAAKNVQLFPGIGMMPKKIGELYLESLDVEKNSYLRDPPHHFAVALCVSLAH
jgi:hypothetical protein